MPQPMQQPLISTVHRHRLCRRSHIIILLTATPPEQILLLLLTVNGTLTLNSSSVLDMVTYALSGTLSGISGTGTLKTQNTSALPIPTGKSWTGTIEYNNATGGQT